MISRSRVATIALIAGLVLVLASMVPLLHSLWLNAGLEADESLNLPPDSSELVVANIDARQSLRVDLTAVGPPPTVRGTVAASRYTVHIENHAGRTVHQEEGVLALAASADPRLQARVGPITLDPVNRHSLRVEFAGVSEGLRTVALYYDPPAVMISFFATVLIVILGLLLALSGTIQLIRDAEPISDRPARGNPDERAWGMACHLFALAGYLLPMGHLLAPWLLWRRKRRRLQEVEIQGRESLNFQLSITVYALVALLFSFVFVGLLMLGLIVAFHFSMTLLASMRVLRGEPANYPFTMRIVPTA